MSKNPKIAIIVPTYQAGNFLKDCLDSLARLHYRNFFLILADQNPKSISSKIFPSQLKNKHLKLRQNLGVTGGRNAGLKEIADSEFVLFLDHDMVVAPNLLDTFVKFLKTHPQAGILTCPIYYVEAPKKLWAAGFKISRLSAIPTAQTETKKASLVEVAPAVIFVRRQVLKEIGGFDQRYFAVYEDADFALRAKEKGWQVYCVPKTLALHYLPSEDKKATPRLLSRSFLIARNRLFFLRRFSKIWPLSILIHFLIALRYLFLSIKIRNLRAFSEFILGTKAGFKGSPPLIYSLPSKSSFLP